MNLRFPSEQDFLAELGRNYARVGTPQPVTNAQGTPIVEANLAYKFVNVWNPGLAGRFNLQVEYMVDVNTGEAWRTGGVEREEAREKVRRYLDSLPGQGTRPMFAPGFYAFIELDITNDQIFAKLIANELTAQGADEKLVGVYQDPNGAFTHFELGNIVQIQRPGNV